MFFFQTKYEKNHSIISKLILNQPEYTKYTQDGLKTTNSLILFLSRTSFSLFVLHRVSPLLPALECKTWSQGMHSECACRSLSLWCSSVDLLNSVCACSALGGILIMPIQPKQSACLAEETSKRTDLLFIGLGPHLKPSLSHCSFEHACLSANLLNALLLKHTLFPEKEILSQIFGLCLVIHIAREMRFR